MGQTTQGSIENRWVLFADPRDKNDQILIDLFGSSDLIGSAIPTGRDECPPELSIVNYSKSIFGHEEIKKFLEAHQTKQ